MSHLHPGDSGAGTAPGRRSAHLRSQIDASDEGSGLALPSTTRPHPQIDANANGDGAVVPIHCRSSKRRSTQIQAIQIQGVGRVTPQEPPASLPVGEDMLREILVRLPLDLYSLTRAAAVCKPWRRILVDPKFLRRFYAHHRKPPLLGLFFPGEQITFTPVLAHTPHLIPPGLLSFGLCSSEYKMLDCRHGRVLLKDLVREELLVCDPITNSSHPRVPIPLKFKLWDINAAVLCAARDKNHVHGACQSSPFELVLVSVGYYIQDWVLIARVYSSQTHAWSNVIRAEANLDESLLGLYSGNSTLIGNALYWPARYNGDHILEFDLGTQNLTVIKGPHSMNTNGFDDFHMIETEDGVVGLAAFSHHTLQMWHRKVDCGGVTIWSLWKTVSLSKLLKISPRNEWIHVVGYDEDIAVIFLTMPDGVYMVQPKSMQARKLDRTCFTYGCHTFTSLYPLDTAIAGGTNGAEILG